MNTCASFLKAARNVARENGNPTDAGAAVLGDALGYTVELADGEQVYVGRTHCKYCARAEAISQLAARAERAAEQLREEAPEMREALRDVLVAFGTLPEAGREAAAIDRVRQVLARVGGAR